LFFKKIQQRQKVNEVQIKAALNFLILKMLEYQKMDYLKFLKKNTRLLKLQERFVHRMSLKMKRSGIYKKFY